VVKVRTASAREDARAVKLENRLVGLNGDRNWLLVQSRHKSLLAVNGNILKASHATLRDPRRAARSLAAAAHSLVRVACFSADGVVLSELEGIVHEATVTSRVNLVAVHELLFAERDEIPTGDLPSSLQRASRRERPA